jgi:2-oxoglutarate/2-oxoacid ferredoxin oxidoreductase subunit beta
MSFQYSDLEPKAKELLKLEAAQKHTWCSGCGNFGISTAIKNALAAQDILPHQAMLCFDVGCSGNESDKIGTNTIHGLHGRVLPLATGIKLANPDLPVIAQAGDGATFSEGINHLIHSIRNNFNITFVVHNNQNYGLTIGQASSTSHLGMRLNGGVDEVKLEPLNTIDLVLSANPSFVARGFAGKIEQLSELIIQGMKHNGFSYIEVMQMCPTFNKHTPQEWYWDKIYDLAETDYDHTDIWAARKLASQTDQIALGLIYQNNRQTWEDNLSSRQGVTSKLIDEVQAKSLNPFLAQFI